MTKSSVIPVTQENVLEMTQHNIQSKKSNKILISQVPQDLDNVSAIEYCVCFVLP
jgi:hypothetical protein